PISEVFRNNLQRVLAQKTLVYEGKRIGTVEDFLQPDKILIEQKDEVSYELNSDSDSYDLCCDSGQSLHELGKINEAILAYQKAIEIGCDLADEDRIEKAVKACQKIIELNSNSSFRYESLGKLLAEKGRLDEAIEMYRTAIKLNPGFHGFHYHLAQALIKKNDYQNAITELLSCIDKNFQHYPSYDLIGDLLIQQGQEAQLMQLYKQGLLAMRHSSTDYQKIIQKISDLGLEEEKIFNDSFLK
ncbi:MAG: tetratricopeptide repeat protein, partial [Planktothrix sp.]